MRFQIKTYLLFSLVFLSFAAVKAQQTVPTTANEDDEFVCGLKSPELIQIKVSVSGRSGDLSHLSYKDFVVYDERKRQEIVFFKFDELKNQYTIGFYKPEFILNNNWHKVKVKLSAEKKKEYGKIFVSGQNGYYPNQN